MNFVAPFSGHYRFLFFFAIGSSCLGQSITPNLDYSLPTQQVVIEGRNVSFKAPGAQSLGSFQWQVAAPSTTLLWTDLTDDGVHAGTSTQSLEISKATPAMDRNLYRFTLTNGNGRFASNALRLTVSPLLLRSPVGIIVNEQGVLLVTDADNHTIWQVRNAAELGSGNDVTCPIGLIAGNAGQAGATDGTGANATFNRPSGLANADGGALLVTDSANATLRRLSVEGTSTTFAGSSTVRGNTDAAGIAASFGAPMGIARAPDGSFYVADSTNHTIRKITADGVVSTLAGSPGNAGFANGRGSAARFNRPTGVTVDRAGRILVTDTVNNLIRAISPDGTVETFAGVIGVAGARDGTPNQALFNGPTAIVALGSGAYIADTGNSTIRFIDAEGEVTTYAGVPGVGGLRDGNAVLVTTGPRSSSYRYDMLLNQPQGLAFDPRGLLYIADTGNAAIRVISYYDGVAMTLPLVPASFSLPPPFSPPASPPPPAPVAPPPPTIQRSDTAPSGGGAISACLLLALAGLRLLTGPQLARVKRRRT